MPRKVNTAKCVGCGACVEVCPVTAIKVTAKKAKIDAKTCIDCGACEATCPQQAISEA